MKESKESEEDWRDKYTCKEVKQLVVLPLSFSLNLLSSSLYRLNLYLSLLLFKFTDWSLKGQMRGLEVTVSPILLFGFTA